MWDRIVVIKHLPCKYKTSERNIIITKYLYYVME